MAMKSHTARKPQTKQPCIGPEGSDAATLGRTAAVVRGGRDVLDGADLETGRLKRTDGRLTTRTRALDEHVDLAHAVLLRATGGRLGGHLRGERRGLPGALEADVVEAEAQEITLPEGSVIETIVLLNVLLMCA